MMTVRSEGQFNTVVYEEEDAFRGVDKRDVILMNLIDMNNRGLKNGHKVKIQSKTGRIDNFEVRAFNIKAGNCLMYYPESNGLISRDLDPHSKTPGFKFTKVDVTSIN